MPVTRPLRGDVEHVVIAAVEEIAREMRPHAPGPVLLDSDLERDLGLDSLAVAELLSRLEESCDVSLPSRLLGTVATPRDLLEALPLAGGRHRAEPVEALGTEPSTPAPQPLTTVAESLDWHASAHSDRVTVRILGDEGNADELTYGELRDQARGVAAGLQGMGVVRGDSVALMLPTSLDYFVTFLGVMLAGAVPVPLYPPVRRAQLEDHLRRQSRILDNARAVLLVTTTEASLVARLLRSSVESLREVRTPTELALGHGLTLSAPRPDDVAMLQYTSGSTGNPKGVVLTHRQLLANIDAMARATQVGPGDVFVSWLPLYHDMGLIGAWLGSLYVGMPLVSMSPTAFLVRPVRWLQAISEHEATISAAPNFAYELCLAKVNERDLASLDLSSWRLAFNGAEAVRASTIRRFTDRFAGCGFRPEAMTPVYGLAEAAVGLAFPPVGRGPVIDRVRRTTFVTSGRAEPAGDADPADEVIENVAYGLPLPGYEIRVVDAGGGEHPDRNEGRILFRGPSATNGYLRNPEATAELFRGDWLDTGDTGYLADGDVYVTGRVKDMISLMSTARCTASTQLVPRLSQSFLPREVCSACLW